MDTKSRGHRWFIYFGILMVAVAIFLTYCSHWLPQKNVEEIIYSGPQ